jgi:hypothetical protein
MVDLPSAKVEPEISIQSSCVARETWLVLGVSRFRNALEFLNGRLSAICELGPETARPATAAADPG